MVNSVAVDDEAAIEAYSGCSNDPLYTRQQLLEAKKYSKAMIIAPGGEIIAGPLDDDEGILFANITLDQVIRSKFTIDVAGHYNRPEIFAHHFEDMRKPQVGPE